MLSVHKWHSSTRKKLVVILKFAVCSKSTIAVLILTPMISWFNRLSTHTIRHSCPTQMVFVSQREASDSSRLHSNDHEGIRCRLYQVISQTGGSGICSVYGWEPLSFRIQDSWGGACGYPGCNQCSICSWHAAYGDSVSFRLDESVERQGWCCRGKSRKRALPYLFIYAIFRREPPRHRLPFQQRPLPTLVRLAEINWLHNFKILKYQK